MFYNVEQRNDSCDVVLPVAGKERLGISDKVYFIETFAVNTFSERMLLLFQNFKLLRLHIFTEFVFFLQFPH